jgi:hypothetical protein
MTNDTMDNANQVSRVLIQRVACDWQQAYALAADPRRAPDWASGLAKSEIQPDPALPGQWVADTPGGRARLRFAPPNDLGVLDHWVTPQGAAEVYIPFRVIATGPGQCEFQFTLLRQPGMDDATFARDSDWVARDLRALQALLVPG